MILVLLHLFLGRPIIRYLKKQRSELENQSQRIKEAETLVKTLPDLEKSIEIIEDDLRKIHERTVTKDQIPRIFKELTLKTRELGIGVVSIKPREDINPILRSCLLG
jgi:predicted  nucleic acid-binding Zn-ribbon protein